MKRPLAILAISFFWAMGAVLAAQFPPLVKNSLQSDQTVATLFLARGSSRVREFAMRQALGASRGRLVRQMLTESLLLATVGGALGLLLARWVLDTAARLRPPDIALVDHVPVDARSALIACGVTLLAALVAGLLPSVQLSRPAAARALREGRSSAGRLTHNTLVVLGTERSAR